MPRMLLGLCVLALNDPSLALPARVFAAEVRLTPEKIHLSGPNARQQVLVLLEDQGRIVADRTEQAKFTSSEPSVARVDEGGMVYAAGDGEAVITATIDGKKATAVVQVVGARQTPTPSFRNDIIPALTRLGCNAGACHGALAGKGGLKLSLRGYDPEADHFALTRQANGRRVDLQSPARSLMLRKPTAALPHGGGNRFKPGDPAFQLLLDWIAAGAPGPQMGDPQVIRLEVFPSSAVLKPQERMQIVVRARYSDGRAIDATRLSRFASSEEATAGVDEEGRIVVRGPGEAVITVGFDVQVAAVRILVPFGHEVDARAFELAALPFESPGFSAEIDRLILKKLQELRLPPAPHSSDREFIRRAYLDAAGILPTPEEVRRFAADDSPDKRRRLIDSLLERPEFVDYWTYKWSDLLLVSTRKLSQPAVWSFYQYIRDSVAQNKPWDEFAREIVTASGSNFGNGAVNYFVLHKDAAALAETTATTFLGTSIACARCHNHPLEKWTQDQYWSFANLFSRVGLKNGDRSGEILVQSQPSGEVFHPRRGTAMPPTPLNGPPMALDAAADRRQVFADWLTTAENPLFARAVVNRVWRNFMGRGLVEAEDDLRQTNPASNEELLDALARKFVAEKYDLRWLMRAIMNTAAYQRSSRPLPENAADDRFYSRYLVRRLPAEVVLDAYSQITGVPTPFDRVQVGTTGGTAATRNYPLGTRALQLPDTLVVSQFLDAFGRPERGQTCSCERSTDSSVGQALHLSNGNTLNDKLRAPDSIVARWLAEDLSDDQAIGRIFELAVCRDPTPAERDKLAGLMREAAAAGAPRKDILEDLAWAVLTGKEFLFNR